MRWRETLLAEVPMRAAVTVDLHEPIADDARFADDVVLVTEHGQFHHCLSRHSVWLHRASRHGIELPARVDETSRP